MLHQEWCRANQKIRTIRPINIYHVSKLVSELFPDTSLSGDEENNEDFFYHGLLNADSSTV